MIKDNQQHFNRLHVIIDAFVIVVSYILAWWLKFSSIATTNRHFTLGLSKFCSNFCIRHECIVAQNSKIIRGDFTVA
jgi:hypothetical protein